MHHFLVRQARGPAWDPARGRREQDGWKEHATFVDGLAEAGTLLLAGPLGEVDGLDVALVVLASSAEAAGELFVPDPWNETILRTVSVEPWTVWVGADRLSAI
jgi:uncharacterized protein YciI